MNRLKIRVCIYIILYLLLSIPNDSCMVFTSSYKLYEWINSPMCILNTILYDQALKRELYASRYEDFLKSTRLFRYHLEVDIDRAYAEQFYLCDWWISNEVVLFSDTFVWENIHMYSAFVVKPI